MLKVKLPNSHADTPIFGRKLRLHKATRLNVVPCWKENINI